MAKRKVGRSRKGARKSRRPGRPRKRKSKGRPRKRKSKGRPRKSRKPGRPRKRKSKGRPRKSRKPGRPRKSGSAKRRNFPPYPASEYIGSEMMGNDGYMYEGKRYRSGASRWVKLPADQQPTNPKRWDRKFIRTDY